jgi:hypothetical protein
MMAGLMILTEDGNITINGNLHVAGDTTIEGTLLSNLLAPTDFGNPFQVQVAGIDTDSDEVRQSRFEIIDELGTPVATISAQGRAQFAGGVAVGSEVLTSENGATVLETSKTSGRATIPAYTNQVTIYSSQISEGSLIYVTPVGSTGNQVMYVRAQQAEIEPTLAQPGQPAQPGQKGMFVVGFDRAVTQDVVFNWWIVN